MSRFLTGNPSFVRRDNILGQPWYHAPMERAFGAPRWRLANAELGERLKEAGLARILSDSLARSL